MQLGSEANGIYLQVSKEYTALRQEAIGYAQARNKFFQQSTEVCFGTGDWMVLLGVNRTRQAFLQGDKAAATNLSKEGRRYDQVMLGCYHRVSC